MLVTSFRLKKIENPTNRLIARCTLTFDAMLAVSDIKILVKEDGEYYMGMPSRKTVAGTFKDEAYPVNSDVRHALERIIFGAMKHAEAMEGIVFDGEIKQGHGKVSLLQQDVEDFTIETL
ncbi:MAG: SpoVG family protein [Clostridia bacterium]|nr:SpoVG family protein [Clostridia bacterium]